YDQNGERILKGSFYNSKGGVDGEWGSKTLSLQAHTVYVNPYYVSQHYVPVTTAYKHYYMGSQRVATTEINFTTDPLQPQDLAPFEPGASGSVNYLGIILQQLYNGDLFGDDPQEVEWGNVLNPIE